MQTRPLRIFVAMPGTSLGANASFSTPASVKENLLQPVAEKLRAQLGRDIEIVIEKEKISPGVIHESMFAEARDAEVYIADLTGANPNVYLELGVRWALKDKVTIVICQNVLDLRFNVVSSRAIIYSPNNIFKAVDDIAASIKKGLASDKPDNPVRLNSDLIIMSRSELESLEERIKELTLARGEDFLRAAKVASPPTEKLRLLQEAYKVNPASTNVLLEIGLTHRSLRNYVEASEALRNALRLAPDDAVLHRELGITLSKDSQLDEAVKALREAVKLNPTDAEAWSNLGGALRRIGMVGAPKIIDEGFLLQSRDSYEKAHELNRFDLYAALNICRLDLLLSKWDASRALAAQTGFSKQIYLCQHMIGEAPNDYWKHFDLADALLFSGKYKEAHDALDAGIKLVVPDIRADTLESVLNPLRNYVAAKVVKGELLANVQAMIARLEASKKDSGTKAVDTGRPKLKSGHNRGQGSSFNKTKRSE